MADPKSEEETFVVVGKLMLALPSTAPSEASTVARGEAFMMALDDIPTWAVRAAARRWCRGDAGDKYDYHWCPAPAELRALALTELWRVVERTNTLKRLLRAEPLIEYSEEHCARMRQRLQEFLREIGNPAGRVRRQQQGGSPQNDPTVSTVGCGQGTARSEA
jgi:hypothetical protein